MTKPTSRVPPAAIRVRHERLISRGLVGDVRQAAFRTKVKELDHGRTLLQSLSATPSEARKAGIAVNADGHSRSAFDLLAYPQVGPAEIVALWPQIGDIGTPILQQLAIDAQYAVYLDRQQADVEAMRRDEGVALPHWLDYAAIPGLSNELRQKLGAQRPATLAQAQAIEGMTPAAALLILALVSRGSLRKAG